MLYDYKRFNTAHPKPAHNTHMDQAGGFLYMCCDTCGFGMTLDEITAGFPVEDYPKAKKHFDDEMASQGGA